MAKKTSKMLNNLMSENALTCILLVVVLGLLIYTVMIYKENFDGHEPTGTTAEFVMFYADWCPHCQTAKPEVEKLKEQLEGNNNMVNNTKVEVVLVDCVADPETAKENNVQGFPTLMLKHNGETKDYNGARNAGAFMEYLENNL